MTRAGGNQTGLSSGPETTEEGQVIVAALGLGSWGAGNGHKASTLLPLPNLASPGVAVGLAPARLFIVLGGMLA